MNQVIAPPTTLEEKIGQLINVRIGSNLPPARPVDDDFQRVAALLGRCPIGGLTLFNGKWPSTRDVLEQLQSPNRIPLLVGADIERGCGQQMHGMGLLPHAGAFAAAGEKPGADARQLAFEFGQATAAEARLAGIHVAFAPVADTNTNSRNPIIATRAFGTSPTRTAEMVAAFVQGCESAGVAATAKHFPGHGDTEQDSHDSLPVVTRNRASLALAELPPFVAAIAAGCSMIMTAHVAYPALDASGRPATLSREILGRLLREELGFDGVVCSDSLLMSGVRDQFDNEGELCLAALQAGVDWLLDVAEPEAVVESLSRAVAEGRLDEPRVDESVARILNLKQRVCRTATDMGDYETTRQRIDLLSDRVSFQAITAVDATKRHTLDCRQPVTCLLAKPFTTPLDPPEQPLAAALRSSFSAVDYFELGPAAPPALIEAAQRSARDSQQLILAMIVKPAAWHKFGLLDYQQKLFAELADHSRTVLVSLGVPAILESFPGVSAKLCAYSDIPSSQRAVVRYLTQAG